VSQALSSIHAVLNAISETLLDSTLIEDVIAPGTGALALLYVIRDGVEADKVRTERISSGRPAPGDLGHRPVLQGHGADAHQTARGSYPALGGQMRPGRFNGDGEYARTGEI
jgi:hypothetical protein